jgi:hypothetical protein
MKPRTSRLKKVDSFRAPHFRAWIVVSVGTGGADGRPERLLPHRCTEVDTPFGTYGLGHRLAPATKVATMYVAWRSRDLRARS